MSAWIWAATVYMHVANIANIASSTTKTLDNANEYAKASVLFANLHAYLLSQGDGLQARMTLRDRSKRGARFGIIPRHLL